MMWAGVSGPIATPGSAVETPDDSSSTSKLRTPSRANAETRERRRAPVTISRASASATRWASLGTGSNGSSGT